ncbi:MAG TPA: xanthine dehydrogenase family protein subunit M [Streptosporangiales bacterium]
MTHAAPFEYQTADSWDEAVELVRIWGDDGKVLAGGQSLVPMLNLRIARPAALVDINPIPTPEPHLDGDTLVVPALTRHQVLLRSPVVREHCPLLSAAVAQIGNVRVRARGTIGGSVSHADPTGEIPCTVTALGGQMVVRGPGGVRTIDTADFFVTYLTTALDEGELVTEIRLPVRGHGDGYAFDEKVRRASDFAMVEVAATVRLAGDGRTVDAASAVVGGVADKPHALDADVLAPLLGGTGGDGELRAVGSAAADGVSPESDVHATGAYRRRLTDVLTRRTLAAAIENARSSWN